MNAGLSEGVRVAAIKGRIMFEQPQYVNVILSRGGSDIHSERESVSGELCDVDSPNNFPCELGRNNIVDIFDAWLGHVIEHASQSIDIFTASVSGEIKLSGLLKR